VTFPLSILALAHKITRIVQEHYWDRTTEERRFGDQLSDMFHPASQDGEGFWRKRHRLLPAPPPLRLHRESKVFKLQRLLFCHEWCPRSRIRNFREILPLL
jgi:hypothetical protein